MLVMTTGIDIMKLNWGYIGIVEKKMETTIISWGYIWIMEKKTETIIAYKGLGLSPSPIDSLPDTA